MGKALARYEKGATEEPFKKTCPMFYQRSVFVQSIMRELPDYKRGALGNTRKLGSAFRTYLQVAENEQAAWESEMERQLSR